MPRKRHGAEEIITKLRQLDVLIAKGRPVTEAVRSIGATEVTDYRRQLQEDAAGGAPKT